ncbi:hypothetical protein AMTR_s00035p00223940 [Amborella trichopoda]|uniref:Uncharacterized protein n=1 Tax=Amborella trichopoda TaxID=13333 RepID=W1PPW6_AMBTC|nr:hypothetical protein AMTR_s00035p00223940 [Amborella trichopoda]
MEEGEIEEEEVARVVGSESLVAFLSISRSEVGMVVKNLGSDNVNKGNGYLVASNEWQKVTLRKCKSQGLELTHVDVGVVLSDKPRQKCQKQKKRHNNYFPQDFQNLKIKKRWIPVGRFRNLAPGMLNENGHLLPLTFPSAFIKDSSVSELVNPSFSVRPQGPPNLLTFGNVGVVDPSKDQLTYGRPLGPSNPLVFGRFGGEGDPSNSETRSRSHDAPSLEKDTLA